MRSASAILAPVALAPLAPVAGFRPGLAAVFQQGRAVASRLVLAEDFPPVQAAVFQLALAVECLMAPVAASPLVLAVVVRLAPARGQMRGTGPIRIVGRASQFFICILAWRMDCAAFADL
jgi:hypothetical protein